MDEATTESLRIWDSLAPGWDKTRVGIDRRERPINERLHAALETRAGDTILELCAGPGEVGLQLAEKEPQATVVITDFSPGMVDAAQNEAQRRGIRNVECRLMDAQNIALPDSSVDGVLARCGLMLVPDIPKAFEEVRRVLREGRTLAYTTWAPLVANPWMMIFGAAMIQRGHFAPPQGGGFMPLGSEEENIAVATSAGFKDVHAESVDFPHLFDSFEEYWALNTEIAGPLTVILKGLPPEEVDAVRAQVEEFSAPFATNEGLSFPSRRVFVRAR